jgi:hypothetical protein
MSYLPERRHPRFEFAQFPWVFSLQLDKAWQEDKPLRLEAKNLSLGGLKFQSNRRIPLFEEVQVVIFAKSDGKELSRVRGRVVRLEEVDTGFGEKSYGIALAFTQEEGSRLAALLPTQASTAPR